MVKVVGAPTKEVSGLDVLVGGLGLIALLLLGAVLLGLIVGAVLIGYKRLRPSNPFNGQTADSTGLNLNSYPPVT